MTQLETTQLMGLFSVYWPTFQGKNPETISIWAEALREYPIEAVRRALLDFRGEKERTFAPTVSEFCGTVNEILVEQDEKTRYKSLLEAPPEDNDVGMETYWKDQICGHDKHGKPILKPYQYVRCTKKGREEMQEWYAKLRADADELRAKRTSEPEQPAERKAPGVIPDETYDWKTVFERLAQFGNMPDTEPPLKKPFKGVESKKEGSSIPTPQVEVENDSWAFPDDLDAYAAESGFCKGRP